MMHGQKNIKLFVECWSRWYRYLPLGFNGL